MATRLRWLAIASLLGLAAPGCGAHRPAVAPQTIAGVYSGITAAGQPLSLTFTQANEAFRADGTLGGDPVALAGAVGWRGMASFAGTRSAAPVRLELSPDGEQLAMELDGARVLLQRGGTPVPPPPGGAFSGVYRARSGRALLGRVSLVQRGELVTGIALVAGDPAGVSGRATGPDVAEGVVTFLDGGQAAFRAVLGADRSLRVEGFGEPVTLTQAGAR